MKLSALVIIPALILSTAVQNPVTGVPKTLSLMAEKLKALKTVSYHTETELSYKKDNYYGKFSGDSYFEFNQRDKQSVSCFQLSTENSKLIYNGTEFLTLNIKEKTYETEALPNAKSFGHLTLFYNAIATLRSEVDRVLQVDSIVKRESDTSIDRKNYKMAILSMHKGTLEYLGDPGHFTTDITICYKIIIDPATDLPYQIIQTNNIEPESFTKTTFTDIVIQPKSPTENSWFYSTYQTDFRPKPKKVAVPLVAVGDEVPDWSLPDLSQPNGLKAGKNHFKGKLLMMDFWIKNCGPCMAAFPHLQALQKKYGPQGFQLVSINSYDKKDEVAFFYKREKPVYKMLYDGRLLAKQLGVDDNGYPTVIILNRLGKVIYSGYFDNDKLEKTDKG